MGHFSVEHQKHSDHSFACPSTDMHVCVSYSIKRILQFGKPMFMSVCMICVHEKLIFPQ